MLTLALLAATGNFEEIPMHVRATANTGASPDDVLQAFMHVRRLRGGCQKQIMRLSSPNKPTPRWELPYEHHTPKVGRLHPARSRLAARRAHTRPIKPA